MEIKNSNQKSKEKKSIRWDQVRRQIEFAQSQLEKGYAPTDEEKIQILRSRAQLLAKEEDVEEVAERLEILEFNLAQEKYGIETHFIREVYPLKDFTPLPCTPSFVLGVTNVRGRVISIIDIKKFFDLPEKGLTDLNKLLILHNENMEFGILADAILGIHNIKVADIQPSLPTLTGIRADYLKGVTKEQIVILDGTRLLSDNKIVVHEQV